MATADKKTMLRTDGLTDESGAYNGASLRAHREAANVDIATMSFELRIPKNYIEALEQEDYDVLPGTTYGFGYIRSYCKFLNIEAQPYLDTFKMRTAMTNQQYHFPDEALEPRMSGAMSAMLVVLVLLTGYIGWQVLDRYDLNPLTSGTAIVASSEPEEAATEAEVVAPVSNDTVSVIVPAIDDTAEVVETAEAVPADTALELASNQTESDVRSDDAVEEAPAETVQDTAIASPEAPAQEVLQDSTALAEADDSNASQVADAQVASVSGGAAQANIRQPSEEITISATAAAWVEVVSENGDVVLSKLFQPGDDYIAPADKKLYLSTGNAGGLVLRIPGLDEFSAGDVGEIIRDLPLSRDSVRSRRSSITQ